MRLFFFFVINLLFEVGARAVCGVYVCVFCCWVKSSIVRSLPPSLQVTMGTGGNRACVRMRAIAHAAVIIYESVAFDSMLDTNERHQCNHTMLSLLAHRLSLSLVFSVFPPSLVPPPSLQCSASLSLSLVHRQ